MLIPEKSIKELTRAADSSPSWHFLKTNRFGDANRRGSPSRIEGLGSSIDGVKGKSSPCRFGQSPRSFSQARHGSAKPTSVADPYGFTLIDIISSLG
ncbi:hypothetical protein AT265_25050 [Bacillus cereus]|nr:hypothetical protein AT265_25050 [Bacillus cereus]